MKGTRLGVLFLAPDNRACLELARKELGDEIGRWIIVHRGTPTEKLDVEYVPVNSVEFEPEARVTLFASVSDRLSADDRFFQMKELTGLSLVQARACRDLTFHVYVYDGVTLRSATLVNGKIDQDID